MNILYCGDANILDGLVISVLSILKNTKDNIHIYIFTMKYKKKKKVYKPLKEENIKVLEKIIKEKNKKSFIKLIDITDIFNENIPKANNNTHFTPYCMLRLYADLVLDMPDKILYLDNDVVCLKDPHSLYDMDNSSYELIGALDYYGCHVYKKNLLKRDYMNSGVLLLNMPLIKERELFKKCRELCSHNKMLLPDQSALNWYVKDKLIVDRIYNEQIELTKDTVFRHFSTTFKFWPRFRTQTIKPWHIEEVHNTLKIHVFDDVLEEYQKVMERMK